MRTNSHWSERAACRGLPELFFPPLDEHGNEIGSTVEARKICAHCPVRSECLDAALVTGEEYGIAGGLNARERLSLKRRLYRHIKRDDFLLGLSEVAVTIG